MTTQNAIKKLEKVTGNKVTNDGNLHSIEHKNHIIEFFASSYGDIQCISICKKGLKSDSMTDYFPQTFCNTISQAIKLIN